MDVEMEDVFLPPIPAVIVSILFTWSSDNLNSRASLRPCLLMIVASARSSSIRYVHRPPI